MFANIQQYYKLSSFSIRRILAFFGGFLGLAKSQSYIRVTSELEHQTQIFQFQIFQLFFGGLQIPLFL